MGTQLKRETIGLAGAAALVLLALAPAGAAAQGSGTVRGRVTAAGAGGELARAEVRVVGGGASARTGPSGEFVLRGVAAGERVLAATAAGYREARAGVVVGEGETRRVEFALRPDRGSPVHRLDPITVTATGTARRRSEVPSSVSVVEGDQLARLQAQSVDDVLRDLPNVTTVGGPRGQAEVPQIRGFGADRVVLRLDGARQDFSSGHKGRLFLDPALLERVEVVRGPSSALYGNGGIGGVVSFETRDAEDLLEPGQSAGYLLTPRFAGRNDEWGGFGAAFGRRGEVDVLAGVALRSSDDVDLSTGGELPFSGYDTRSGLAKVGWEPAPGQRLEASYDRFSEESTTPLDATSADSLPDRVADRTSFRENLRVGYDLAAPGSRWLDLSVTAYRSESEVAESRLSDGRRDVRNVVTWGVDASNTSRLPMPEGVEAALTYGAELYRDEAGGDRNGGPLGSFPDGSADFVGAFLQTELRLFDRIRLIPGVRWESFDQRSSDPDEPENGADEVALKTGIQVDATEFLSLYGSWAEGFNAPRLLDLYISGLHFPAPPGAPFPDNFFATNASLEPERSETWEVGGRLSLEDVFGGPEGLLAEATYFRTDAEDFIAREVDLRGGVTTFRNLNRVDAEGLEARLRYEGSRVFAGASWGRVRMREITGGVPVDDAPADTWTVDLGLRLADRQLSVGATGTFAEEQNRVTDPTLATPGWGVVDVRAGWRPDGGPLEGFGMRMRVENATDETYRRHASFVPAPGRSVRIEIIRRGVLR